jgi:hypothetical protein
MNKCFYTSNGNYECNYDVENFNVINNNDLNKQLLLNLTNVTKQVCESSVNSVASQINNIINNIRENCNNDNTIKELTDDSNSLNFSDNIDASSKEEADLALNYMININDIKQNFTDEQKQNIKNKLLETWTPAIKKCKMTCYDNDILIKSIINKEKPLWNENKRDKCNNTIVNVSMLKKENNNLTFPQYEYSCTNFLNIPTK